MQTAANIYIAYAIEDDPYKDRLEEHLAQLKREGLIQHIWSMETVSAGSHQWEKHKQFIAQADLVLLLISSDFISSNNYDTELGLILPQVKQRNIPVIPIILRACLWEGAELENFRPFPSNGTPIVGDTKLGEDQYFSLIAKEIRNLLLPQKNSSKLDSKNKVPFYAGIAATFLFLVLASCLYITSNSTTEETPIPSNPITEQTSITSNPTTEQTSTTSNPTTKQTPITSNSTAKQTPITSNPTAKQTPITSNPTAKQKTPPNLTSANDQAAVQLFKTFSEALLLEEIESTLETVTPLIHSSLLDANGGLEQSELIRPLKALHRIAHNDVYVIPFEVVSKRPPVPNKKTFLEDEFGEGHFVTYFLAKKDPQNRPFPITLFFGADSIPKIKQLSF